jgi:hypothetical protein
MGNDENLRMIPSRTFIEATRDWLSVDIEVKEFLFVFFSFCDASLTSLCLNMGAEEGVPWMRGWCANAALRMGVATAIVLYLKIRGQTKLLWFGNAVLFMILVWNCFMMLLMFFGN